MKEILLILALISIIVLGVYKAQSRKKIPPASLKQTNQKKGGDSLMDLKGKKVLMVIAPNNFRDPEYIEPRRILEQRGAQITVASLNTGESIGAEGTKVKIDLQIQDVDANNFDAVLFVGGPGMSELVNNEDFKAKAREFYEKQKLVSAICIAPAVLANAGILQGKKATIWDEAKETLEKNGAEYTAAKVETDGKIITANGPEAAQEFGKKLAESLKQG